MRMRSRIALVVAAVMLAAACSPAESQTGPSNAEAVAPGVDLFRMSDPSLVESAGPVAVYLLRLDPALVRLDSILSNDKVADAEPVDGIAARHRAIAAVNGGFFNVRNGEPVSLLKVGGELVSDSAGVKGAVVIESPEQGRTRLSFDQLSARVSGSFKKGNALVTLPIDGLDTTRERGKLMLYTPAYHADTDTAPAGTEWVLDGDPLRVKEVRPGLGRSQIPRAGAVLSFGGVDLPPALASLTVGTVVSFETTWNSLHGLSPDLLDHAHHIVNGAGLLRRGGVPLTDWEAENLSPQAFINARHPRTMIGVDGRGFIWLVAVDGRQPEYSIGMTFADLQRLCDRLGLRDALNLDGGGSTTMVVKDQIVNKPSDAAGPRAVSDAIVVRIR